MKTFFSILFTALIVSIFAADPAQPKVGQTPVINATNGYGGILTVRTQVNVGYPTETGILTLSDAGTVTLTLEADVGLIFGPGTTNVLYRSGSDLIYTNGSTTPKLSVVNASGKIANVGTDSSGNAIFSSPTSDAKLEAPAGFEVRFRTGGSDRWQVDQSGHLDTIIDNNYDIGGDIGSSRNAPRTIVARTSVHTPLVYWDSPTNTVFDSAGTGSPEGVTTAKPGSLYRNYSGGSGTSAYVKESGAGNTGWVALGAGGSGDTIWTNNAGLIELIGSTDVILNPAVADGGGTPFIFGSSNVLTSGNLMEVKNMGTNKYSFSADGLEVISGVGGTFAELTGSMSPSDYATGGTFDLFADSNSAFLYLYVDGDPLVIISPNEPDGTTPFYFETGITHTSGNLAEFKNNGTNKVNFDYLGNIEALSLTSITSPNNSFSFTDFADFPTISYGGNAIALFGSQMALNYLSDNHVVYAEEGSHNLVDAPIIINLLTNVMVNGRFILGTTNTSSNPMLFHSGTNVLVKLADDSSYTDIHAANFVMEASAIQTSTTSGHSGGFKAYDEDDATYRTFAVLQNGNTPSLTIAPPSGGSVTLQGILKAADGTSGITQTNLLTIPLVLTNQIIIRNGLIVSWISI